MISRFFVARAHEITDHSAVNKTPVSSVAFSYCSLSTSLLYYTFDLPKAKVCGLSSEVNFQLLAFYALVWSASVEAGVRACASVHVCVRACERTRHPCCCFGEAAQRSSHRTRSSSVRHSSPRGGFLTQGHLKHLCFLEDLGDGDRQKLGKHQHL